MLPLVCIFLTIGYGCSLLIDSVLQRLVAAYEVSVLTHVAQVHNADDTHHELANTLPVCSIDASTGLL